MGPQQNLLRPRYSFIFFKKESERYEYQGESDVKEAEKKEHARQSSEIFVVLPADAVVEPLAVVVEFRTAPIALGTVFGIVTDVGFAHITVKFKRFPIMEVVCVVSDIKVSQIALLKDEGIERVCCGSCDCESQHGSRAYQEE